MPASVLLTELLLPQTAVSLGRFVTNIYQPHADYHDPALDSSPYTAYKLQNQYSAALQSVDQHTFASKLTTLISFSLSKRADTSIRISSDQIKTYYLIDTEKWFEDAIQSEATRKWIESAVEKGKKIYLVTGYHTILDARIIEQSSEQRDSTVKPLLSVLRALSPSAGVTPIVDKAEVSSERKEGEQREFIARGEQVYAMQYRKVRCRRLWRIDSVKLAKGTQWLSLVDPLFPQSDGEDTIEVELDEEATHDDAGHEITTDTEEIVEFMPDDYPDVVGRFNTLGANLLIPYKRISNMEGLEQEIRMARQALQVTPGDHQDLAPYLSNLGNKLEWRYEYTGKLEDLEESIQRARRAVQIASDSHQDLAAYLNNLGNKLGRLYERTGKLEDLEESIQTARRAVQITPDGDHNIAGRLNNLGNKLGRRYECSGDMEDLEESIQIARRAVQIASDSHQDLAAYLNNLGNKLGRLYERTGKLEDLEESIQTARRAVQITPDGDHNIAGRLNNLGNKLGRRYECSGDMEDLENSIRFSQQAVDVTPENHPNLAAYLNNRGNKLESRYKRVGKIEDLDEAIQILQQAVEVTPYNHPSYAACLSNLGNKLESRYTRTRNMSDLERAIKISQEVVQAIPESHPDRAVYLDNFGNKLRRRYESTGDINDLEEANRISEEAIRALQQALHVTTDDQISASLSDLASKPDRQDDRTREMDQSSEVGSMAAQASTYRNQEQWDTVEELNFQVMEIPKGKLRLLHPNTLASVSILASVLVNQGRYVGARLLELKLLEMRNNAAHTRLGVSSRTWKGIPRSIVLVDTLYYLKTAMGISDAPVQPGIVRLCWKCPCGRRFHQDIPQKLTDLSMFKTIIQDAINSIEERSLRTVILSAIRSHVGTTRSSKARSTAPEQIRKITGHTGKHPNSEGSDVARDAEQPISGAEATSSQFSTSQSTSNTMKDPEGIRRRVIASDVQRAETEDESNAEGKWILIALPKDKFMTVEHMDVIRAQTDVQLFCEIRKRYEARRQLRRRFLELHDVNKLHLVKFHLRQIPEESGKLLDVASKTEKYEPPDKVTDLNWEAAAQDIGLESLPQFLMLLWHRARQKECKDAQFRRSWWSWSRPKAEPEGQFPGLPTHEQRMSNRRKMRWQDSALSIRIFLEDSNHRVSAWFRRFENSKSPPQELTEPPGIEIELSSDSFYVNYEVPRRIRKQLCTIKNKPVSGWGLWIEEDFIIPWYALLVFNCIPITSAVVGVYFSTKYGLGWLAVGGYGVAVSSFILTQWIVKAKDSRR